MTTAQPCKGCGAPIDCDSGDDFIYSLTADPTLPFFFLCPPPYTCRPPIGQTVNVSINCCGHVLSATILPTTTDAELSAIMQNLLTQCQQFAGECPNPPLGPGQGPISPDDPNPRPIYFNQPVRCAAGCPDGSTFYYTIPAGSTVGLSQADADAAAAARCPNAASANKLCLGSLPEVGCINSIAFEELVASSIHTPISFSISAGAIPTGTTFGTLDASTAVLSGTLTVPGTYTFTVSATDSIGQTVTKSYTINVFGITNEVLPDGFVGDPYSQQLLTAGGTGAVTFSVDPDTLPGGLSMDASGLITGTPTITGVTGFDVTFTDSEGTTCTQTVTIEVETFDCITNSDTLPDGTVGVAYSQVLTSTFGTGPRTFATTDPLPAGLTLHSDGTIDGTPTTAGTTSFDVTVTDALSDHCSDLCTIEVVSACPDWNALSWDAPLTQVNAPFATLLNNFTASTSNPGVLQVYGHINPYNGGGCNGNLHVVITNVNMDIPGSTASILIYNNGNGTQIINIGALATGVHDIPFITNAFGTPYDLKLLVELQVLNPGSSVSIDVTVTNVP